ncbi:MAG: hypothetical protein HFE84_08110 [Lachnospiraceae bacterium]|nr:hypothetical protein [Lachnospiraceae bacterium]
MKPANSLEHPYRLPAAYAILYTLSFPLLGLSALADALLSLAYPEQAASLQFVRIHVLLIALYLLLLFVLGAALIVRSFANCRQNHVPLCVNSLLILKYGMIPFFIMNFGAYCFFYLVLLVASRGTILFGFPILLVSIAAATFLTWLTMLPGAFYGIQVIRLCRRQEKLGLAAALFHGILQFTFLLDIPDTMYLTAGKFGMGKRCAWLAAVLYTVFLTALVYGFQVLTA